MLFSITNNKNKEYGWEQVYNITQKEFDEIFTDKKYNKVNPLINNYENDELCVMHNHTNGTILSPKDFGMCFYSSKNI